MPCDPTGIPELLMHVSGPTDVDIVVCIVVGCWRKSEKKNTQGFFRIPSFVKNQGEEFEETTTERRNLWISAVSRDDDQGT